MEMLGKKREGFDSLTGNVCPLRVHLEIHGRSPTSYPGSWRLKSPGWKRLIML
jgi:hypothetical protein